METESNFKLILVNTRGAEVKSSMCLNVSILDPLHRLAGGWLIKAEGCELSPLRTESIGEFKP